MSDGRRKKRRRPVSEKARRRRRRFFSILAVLFAAAAVIVSIAVFMKIETVSIEGDLDYYSAEEISSVTGDLTGKNLVFLSTTQIRNSLLTEFPYLDDVEFTRVFPSKLVITVTEVKNCICIPCTGGNMILSDGLRIIETSEKDPSGVTKVYGIQPAGFEAGTLLTVDSGSGEDNTEELKEMISVLEEYELLGKVTSVNISDRLNISMVYDDRIYIIVGTISDLDYKIKTVKTIVDEKIGSDETGTLDVSYSGQTKRSYYEEGEPQYPSGYFDKASGPPTDSQ
ncbi:MAG: cell division protein FtsQ/DivIB [Oscillospiraceae bacterium]|jgi:cell division septal protein FtsQ